MNKIIARYVSDQDSEKRDGSGRVVCPFCSEGVPERDIEQYAEDGTDRSLEMCTNCREGFERDLGLDLGSDVLPADTFHRIWDEFQEPRPEPASLIEQTAGQLARILGGDAWQSGGNVWLVVIRRKDGSSVVISDEVIAEYASEEDFDDANARHSILLR